MIGSMSVANCNNILILNGNDLGHLHNSLCILRIFLVFNSNTIVFSALKKLEITHRILDFSLEI